MEVKWDARVLAVLEQLEQAGHRAVLVGGCVRDRLLGRPLHDYDGATSALPDQIISACNRFRCLETGKKHGTITVLSQGLPVEVTTFRTEAGYSDHRHPDQVAFTPDLALDLARRDFTINAMAWGRDGLVDLYGGQADLENRLIRCVGDPDQRFEEDALRLLRGLRLAAQLEFSIHPDTARAIHSHAQDLAHVAWERICAEFLRLICSPGAGTILLDFSDVVCQLIPELEPCVGFDQRNPHHCYDVYTHSVKAMAAVPPVPTLRLAALLHDVGKPATFSMDDIGTGHFYGHPKVSAQLADRALARLRLDNSTREQVVTLIARHDLPVEPTRQWAGRWLSRLGVDTFFLLLDLKWGDREACAHPSPAYPDPLAKAEEIARSLLKEQACLSLKDLAVNGRDCITAGLQGKEIGNMLHRLLALVAEDALPNDRERLLREIKKTSS